MCIQTATHDKTCLLSASLLIFQLLDQISLKLLRYRQKRSTDLMILILKFFIHLSDSVNCDIDTVMNISIRDTLGCFIQLLDPLIFQLFTGSFLSHLFQHSLDISCSTVALLPLIVIIILRFSANRL